MTKTTKITELEVQSIHVDAARIIESMQRIQGMSGNEIDPVTFKMMDKLTKTFRSEITKYRFTTAAEYDKTATLLAQAAASSRATIEDIRSRLSNCADAAKSVGSILPRLCENINRLHGCLVSLTSDTRGIPLDAEVELMLFLTAADYLPRSIEAWKNTLGTDVPEHVLTVLNEKIFRFEDGVSGLRARIPTKYLDRK